MTAQAIGGSLPLGTRAAKLSAIGALFFLISDTFLAWDRFHGGLLLGPALVLVPYYVAQLLIALSASSPSTQRPTHIPDVALSFMLVRFFRALRASALRCFLLSALVHRV
jgi:hypothetical protein